MVDQNDSFIREVNEELRSDQVRNAWKRYSRIIIGAAVVIVLGTAGHRLWTHWDSTQASDAGDKFLAALTLAVTSACRTSRITVGSPPDVATASAAP